MSKKTFTIVVTEEQLDDLEFLVRDEVEVPGDTVLISDGPALLQAITTSAVEVKS